MDGTRELVDGERNPFAGRRIKSRQNKVERAKSAKIGFPPAEILKLWQEAEGFGDFELFVAIQLGIHMGWRLEEIAELRCSDVHRTGGLLYIEGGMKTEAGIRSLPVPSAIIPLVEQLMQRTDSGGYLIRSTAKNKWKRRGKLSAKGSRD